MLGRKLLYYLYLTYRLLIESQLPDGRQVPLNIPVDDCYYTGTVVGDSGSVVALSQCNDEMVMMCIAIV